MSGNQTFGGAYESRSAGLGASDALPPAIRRVYCLAPYEYHMTGALQRWKEARADGYSVTQWRKIVIEGVCSDIQRFAAQGWSPDHPDATRSRLGRSS